MQPSPLLKHGRIPLRRSVELRNKIGDILSHPLIRRALYCLLMLCFIIEAYLIRVLMEEGLPPSSYPSRGNSSVFPFPAS